MLNITPSADDYAKLWEVNPLACEQLKVIALMRELGEAQAANHELRAQISRLWKDPIGEEVVPFPVED